MSYNLGDTFYPHHPDGSPLGDVCKNTRYTVGGDVFYQVVDALEQDTSWDILNALEQSTAWDILNLLDQDTSWDILNTLAQATAWDILNDPAQGTSWHIHPAIIDYIARFILKYIETEFSVDNLTTNFTVCPAETSFQVASVIDDNVGVKEITGLTAFNIKQISSDFTLRRSITTNFKITRVLDNTRRP